MFYLLRRVTLLGVILPLALLFTTAATAVWSQPFVIPERAEIQRQDSQRMNTPALVGDATLVLNDRLEVVDEDRWEHLERLRRQLCEFAKKIRKAIEAQIESFGDKPLNDEQLDRLIDLFAALGDIDDIIERNCPE